MPGRKPHARSGRDTAERLHRAAIRLLRLLRREDAPAGVSAPRLSVLSVLVFRGPQTLAALAEAEQVARPTMTSLVQAMERERWIERSPNPDDARSFVIAASAQGRAMLLAGRDRRVEQLAGWVRALAAGERARLEEALPALEKLGGDAPTSPRAGSTPRASACDPRPRRARPRR
jgi:DNA-binding MarR family transcriptional regulator